MSSGFITESEIVEARRKRQEEWEKVRTEDQPKEAPEEPFDSRPLFQRLEEQRLKRDAEYEETHKLKNMIRGLDDDEVGFLDLVEQTKAKAAQQISIEEQKEMKEFRERVSNLAESEELTRLRAQLAPPKVTAANKPNNKLKGVIVRKRKISDEKDGGPLEKQNGECKTNETSYTANESALQVVGVLPGLGDYSNSSSDSSESSDDEESFKLTDVLKGAETVTIENSKKEKKETS